MNAQTRLSSKGQVVIPKEIRDSLALKVGEVLNVSRQGTQIVIESAGAVRERIDYQQFRSLVPAASGPPLSIEDMNLAVARMFEGRGKR